MPSIVLSVPSSIIVPEPVSSNVVPLSVLSKMSVPVLSKMPVLVLSKMPVLVFSKLPVPVLSHGALYSRLVDCQCQCSCVFFAGGPFSYVLVFFILITIIYTYIELRTYGHNEACEKLQSRQLVYRS